jgi:hypothetical protein
VTSQTTRSGQAYIRNPNRILTRRSRTPEPDSDDEFILAQQSQRSLELNTSNTVTQTVININTTPSMSASGVTPSTIITATSSDNNNSPTVTSVVNGNNISNNITSSSPNSLPSHNPLSSHQPTPTERAAAAVAVATAATAATAAVTTTTTQHQPDVVPTPQDTPQPLATPLYRSNRPSLFPSRPWRFGSQITERATRSSQLPGYQSIYEFNQQFRIDLLTLVMSFGRVPYYAISSLEDAWSSESYGDSSLRVILLWSGFKLNPDMSPLQQLVHTGMYPIPHQLWHSAESYKAGLDAAHAHTLTLSLQWQQYCPTPITSYFFGPSSWIHNVEVSLYKALGAPADMKYNVNWHKHYYTSATISSSSSSSNQSPDVFSPYYNQLSPIEWVIPPTRPIIHTSASYRLSTLSQRVNYNPDSGDILIGEYVEPNTIISSLMPLPSIPSISQLLSNPLPSSQPQSHTAGTASATQTNNTLNGSNDGERKTRGSKRKIEEEYDAKFATMITQLEQITNRINSISSQPQLSIPPPPSAQQTNCSNCNKLVSITTRFCSDCGTSIFVPPQSNTNNPRDQPRTHLSHNPQLPHMNTSFPSVASITSAPLPNMASLSLPTMSPHQLASSSSLPTGTITPSAAVALLPGQLQTYLVAQLNAYRPVLVNTWQLITHDYLGLFASPSAVYAFRHNYVKEKILSGKPEPEPKGLINNNKFQVTDLNRYYKITNMSEFAACIRNYFNNIVDTFRLHQDMDPMCSRRLDTYYDWLISPNTQQWSFEQVKVLDYVMRSKWSEGGSTTKEASTRWGVFDNMLLSQCIGEYQIAKIKAITPPSSSHNRRTSTINRNNKNNTKRLHSSRPSTSLTSAPPTPPTPCRWYNNGPDNCDHHPNCKFPHVCSNPACSNLPHPIYECPSLPPTSRPIPKAKAKQENKRSNGAGRGTPKH